MFPFERKMGTLKDYVTNKARPEGSIAERYIDNECLTFCSMYLRNVETIFNERERNYDLGEQQGHLDVFACDARAFGGIKYNTLHASEWEDACMYVLNNCEDVESYSSEHKEELRSQSTRDLDRRQKAEFPKWFEHQIKQKYMEGGVDEELLSLAKGPDDRVKHYPGCNVNGYRFHTHDREMNRKTQNSGVVVMGEHNGKSTRFYGVITDIIELEYLLGRKRVLLFKCDWWHTGDNRGIQIDNAWNITSVNISRRWYRDQPYVLASQAEQVFYVEDMKLGNNWRIVEMVKPRNFFDVPEREEQETIDVDEPYQQEEPGDEVFQVEEDDEVVNLERNDLAPLQHVNADVVMVDESMAGLNEGDASFLVDDDIEEASECSDDHFDMDDIMHTDDDYDSA